MTCQGLDKISPMVFLIEGSEFFKDILQSFFEMHIPADL